MTTVGEIRKAIKELPDHAPIELCATDLPDGFCISLDGMMKFDDHLVISLSAVDWDDLDGLEEEDEDDEDEA